MTTLPTRAKAATLACVPRCFARWLLSASAFSALSCDTLADAPPDIDGMVIQTLVWDLAVPLAQNSGSSCSTVAGEGKGTSFSGSRGDDLWTIETIEHSQLRLQVGSGDEELARRIYGAQFVSRFGRDVFTVETHAGRRVRLFVVAGDNCFDPLPPELFDAGASPTAQ